MLWAVFIRSNVQEVPHRLCKASGCYDMIWKFGLPYAEHLHVPLSVVF
jgi:hypothetical protein